MYTELEGRLLKAKIELMSRSAFISTIALSLRHVITSDVKTADVNGITVRYNPDFVSTLTVLQFATLIAHECWHVAFQHISRRGTRNHFRWNVAGDYVINHTLNKAGFDVLPDWLLDSKYDDTWSTDAVYDDLPEQPQASGNFMLDLNEEQAAEMQEEITDIIMRAHVQAQISGEAIAGSIPGEILRSIDKLLNPKLPWPVILNKFLDQRVQEEYSWARRNRRFRSTYMPSLHNYGLGHLTFAIDTSGSVDDEELRAMLSEIQGIQQVFNPQHMTIIDCDTRIHTVHEIDQNTDILSLKFNGGGGTRFQPVLDYISEHPTQALVYFTDLYGETKLEKVDYPVLWICNSNHKPAPIGETVYVD